MGEIKKIPNYTYETTDGRDDFIDEAAAIEWQEKLDIVDQIVKLDHLGMPTDNIDEAFFIRLKTQQEVHAFASIYQYNNFCASAPDHPGDYFYQSETRHDAFVDIKAFMRYCKDVIKKLNANEQEEASDEGN